MSILSASQHGLLRDAARHGGDGFLGGGTERDSRAAAAAEDETRVVGARQDELCEAEDFEGADALTGRLVGIEGGMVFGV